MESNVSHIVDTTRLRIFHLPEDYKRSEKAICMTKPHKYRQFHLKIKICCNQFAWHNNIDISLPRLVEWNNGLIVFLILTKRKVKTMTVNFNNIIVKCTCIYDKYTIWWWNLGFITYMNLYFSADVPENMCFSYALNTINYILNWQKSLDHVIGLLIKLY